MMRCPGAASGPLLAITLTWTLACLGAGAQEPQPISTLPGFEAELIYSPDPDAQGSWVAICAGPGTTLFAADQYGGLYRVEPAPLQSDADPRVSRLDVDIEGAQGLCWAFDSLYVMATDRGLLRLIDADHDGSFETQQLIVSIKGEAEHGTHAIVVAPDGESLLIVAGNHTPLPALTSSRFGAQAGEDIILEREPDPRGHAVGVMAPGGFICRVSPDGSTVELIAAGFRNCYDLDVSPEGEIFTFDSDMEWDLGLPWYRPARVCHVVSGAEFGWRNGSAKWPAHYEDSLPGLLDVGPASPTGVLFGSNAAFPERYRRALFCLDWTYGIIYALHLQPDGATYGAQLERFAWSKPCPLTDAAVGGDGAMYVTTGGRRLESGLYRIVHRESLRTAHQPALIPGVPTHLAEHRRQLESWHRAGAPPEAIDVIWPALASEDRFIRYAARVALEHQPIGRYLDRAVAESNPAIATMALMAASRTGDPSIRSTVIDALLAIDPVSIADPQRLTWTRALSLTFIRLGAPDERQRAHTIAILEALVPSGNQDVDAEALTLLAYLESPSVVTETMNILTRAPADQPPPWGELAAMNDLYGQAIRDLLDRPPPTYSLRLAYILRTVKAGWSMEDREAYFAFLNRAAASGGGMSFAGYVDLIRARAAETLSDDEHQTLAPLLQPVKIEDSHRPAVPRGLWREWTSADATRVVEGSLQGRDFERGAGLYRTATCSACHQLGGAGASIGPDLSTVANKYSVSDLLRTIIEPSHEVSSQYALSVVTLNDATKLTGRIVDANDRHIRVALNVLDPAQARTIERDRIISIEPSPRSPMPAGLVNAFGPNDLRDLVAYIMSGANPDDPMFSP